MMFTGIIRAQSGHFFRRHLCVCLACPSAANYPTVRDALKWYRVSKGQPWNYRNTDYRAPGHPSRSLDGQRQETPEEEESVGGNFSRTSFRSQGEEY